MSYQERRTIVNLISTVLIVVFYGSYMFQRYPQGDAYSLEVFRFWGKFFVILIPVTIVAKIIITIVFSILHTIATREGEPAIMDERDQLIDLKSTRNAMYVFGLGVVLATGSLAFDMPPAVMFLLLLGAGVAADLLSDVYQFYFYRRGV
ncbi:MAG: hypothetical protein U0528_06590 [Anaerolineae bacterium]